MSLSPEQLAQLMVEFSTMQQQIQNLQARLQAAENSANLSFSPQTSTLASTSAHMKGIKVSSPEYFDGAPSKCRSFILQLQLVFQAQPLHFSNDAAKVTYAATYLRGSALSWFAPYLENNDLSITHNYTNFIQELSSVFGDPDRIASAERTLMTLAQNNRPAYQYASEFRRVMHETKWNEDALASIFYKGLRDDVKDELCKLEKPDSLVKYMELAIKIDNRLFERRQEKKRSSSILNSSQVPHSYIKLSAKPNMSTPERQNFLPQASSTPMEISTIHQSLSPAEKQRRLRSKLCLYCGNPGHFATSCPAKLKMASKVYVTQLPETACVDNSSIQGNEQTQ
jgi:Ty3 transposon capsid-like protein